MAGRPKSNNVRIRGIKSEEDVTQTKDIVEAKDVKSDIEVAPIMPEIKSCFLLRQGVKVSVIYRDHSGAKVVDLGIVSIIENNIINFDTASKLVIE